MLMVSLQFLRVSWGTLAHLRRALSHGGLLPRYSVRLDAFYKVEPKLLRSIISRRRSTLVSSYRSILVPGDLDLSQLLAADTSLARDISFVVSRYIMSNAMPNS
jgi:hypothetical protein